MWSNKYIGIPYTAGGRDENGIDCWGLVRLVYKNEFNIQLPGFEDQYLESDSERTQELIAQYREGWEAVEVPTEGCVILLRVMGHVSHIGIMINNHQFLHAQRGSGSSIQDIEGTRWKDRIAGYYKYVENTGIVLNAVPHPLKTTRITTIVEPGLNLEQLYDKINVENNIPETLKKTVHIFVNGQIVPRVLWSSTVLKNTDTVEYRAVPQNDEFLRTAIVIAAVITGQYYLGPEAAALVGAEAGTIGYNAIVAATTYATAYAASYLAVSLFPIRQQESRDAGSSERQLMISGGQNRANPYGAIPVVLGKVRMTPPLAMNNFITFEEVDTKSTAFLNMVVAWGYGPLNIDESTLRVGNTDITEYDNVTKETVDYQTVPGEPKISNFNRIAVGDVVQNYSGLELVTGGYKSVARNVNQTTWNSTYSGGSYYMRQTNSSGGFVGNTYYSTWNPYTEAVYDNITNSNDIWTQTIAEVFEYSPSATWTESTFDQVLQRVVVAINFPQGLRKIKIKGSGAGDSTSTSVVFNIQRRYKTQGTWSPYDPLYDTLTDITVTANERDGFTYTKSYDILSTYNGNPVQGVEFRIKRVTSDNSEPNDEERLSHTSILHSFTGYYTDSAYPPHTWAPTQPTTCEVAKTAFKIRATDQLNGNIDGISAVVQTVCKTWNGTDWNTLAPTSNPAALFRYVLTHPANPQRIEESDVSTKIDLAALQDWYNYCQNYQIKTSGGPVSKALEYNGVLGSQRSVLEVLRDICAAGRASPALKDGKWTITIDREQSIVVQHFTPHNSWGFESVRALPKYPHAFKVQFFNEEKNYQEDEAFVYSAGYSESNAELFETLNLPGITNKNLAEDFARWHYAQLKLRPEMYTLNTDIEYLVCNRGDRVKVLHDVPMWGLQSGRIKNRLTTSTYELDEWVPITEGESYTIRFRGVTNTAGDHVLNTEKQVKTTWTVSSYSVSATGGVVTLTVGAHPLQVGDKVNVNTAITAINTTSATITAVTSTTITYTKGAGLTFVATTPTSGTIALKTGNYTIIQTTTTTTSEEAANGDLFMFGKLQQETQDLVVLSIEPTNGAKNARLTLTDYGVQPAIAGVTAGYNIFNEYYNYTGTTYFPNISSVSGEQVYSIGTKKPTILTERIVSDASVMTKTSTGGFDYGIRVPFVMDMTLPYTAVMVEGQIDLSNMSYKNVTAGLGQTSVTFTGVEEGKTYSVRLRYADINGKVGPWTDWVQHTVVGRRAIPTAVTGFAYIVNELGIKFTWDPCLDADYSSTIVKDKTGTTWALADYLFFGSASSWTWTNAPSGTYTIAIAHVDVLGNTGPITELTFNYTRIAYSDITVELTNDAHAVPSNADGSSPNLTSSGTDIYVYYSNTLLKYDGVGTANSRWRITSKTDSTGVTSGSIQAVSNPTTGDDYARISDLTALTQDIGSITFNITGKDPYGNTFTVSDYQNFVKQKTGANSVVYRIESSTPVVYKASPNNTTSGTFSSITVSGYKHDGGTSTLYGWLGVTPYVNSTPGTEAFAYQTFTTTPSSSAQTTHWIIKQYDYNVPSGPGVTQPPPGTPYLDYEEIRVVFSGLGGPTGPTGTTGPTGPAGQDGITPDVSNLVNKTTSNILTGTIEPQDSGGIKVGTITWNSSTGALTSGSGIAITEAGIIGAKNGSASFSIDTSGTALFKGDVQTAGDVLAQGVSNNANVPVSIGGGFSSVNYSMYGVCQESSGASSGIIRAGVLGYNLSTAGWDWNVGILAKAKGSPGSGSVGLFAEGGTNNSRLQVGVYATVSTTTFRSYSGTGCAAVYGVGGSASTGAYSFVGTGDMQVDGNITALSTGGGGNIYAYSNVTAYYTSDIRLKENIKPIQSALDKVKKLDGIMFDWKQSVLDSHPQEVRDLIKKREPGVIAQQVQEVLPEVVHERKDGTLSVQYEKLIPLLIEAIKELSERVR